MLDKIIEKKRVFFRYFWQNPKKPDVLKIYNKAIRKENESFFQKREWPFFSMPLFLFPFPFQSVLLSSSALSPNFFSGIVERAKRENAWNHHSASRLSRVGWFSRALTFLSLYYPLGKMRTTSGLKPGLMFSSFALFSFVLFCRFNQCALVRLPRTSTVCPSWTEVNQRLL